MFPQGSIPMLNGTAIAARMFRPKTSGRALEYHLPASVGMFFPTCWNGQETRHHHLESGTCPNCGTTIDSGRLTSLHAIRAVSPGSTKLVLCLDHILTCALSDQLQDKSFLVRPLLVIIGPGKNVVARRTSYDNCTIADISKSANRTVQVYGRYFRGRISQPLSEILKSGEDWLS